MSDEARLTAIDELLRELLPMAQCCGEIASYNPEDDSALWVRLADVEKVLASHARAVEGREDIDVQLLAWAVSNCHTLARRRIHAGADVEFWQHVLRICEKAGARSAGVLRSSLPTEITDGEDVVAARPHEQESAKQSTVDAVVRRIEAYDEQVVELRAALTAKDQQLANVSRQFRMTTGRDPLPMELKHE